jgi:hypothetical protein
MDMAKAKNNYTEMFGPCLASEVSSAIYVAQKQEARY